jgi:hypothetical protein
VLNLIWEVSESAHWDGLFRGISGVSIALGDMWNDHLRVAFSSKSTRFKKWLLKPNTSLIDVKPSIHVIDGVDNEVKASPELVIEQGL